MRTAVWQTGSTDLGRLRERAREAAAAGARLLVTPEAFTSGYAVPDIATAAQPLGGPWHEAIAAIAAEAGLAILYGHPERDGEQVFNAATLVDRDRSVLAHHRKAHLYGDIDRSTYTAGEGLDAIAEIDGLRIGILICYDVEFPEAVRSLALAGVDLVAVPTALMRPYEVVARTLVPTRACENQVHLLYANRCGEEGGLTYCGESCVVGPDGTDLARAGSSDELLLADVVPARLAGAADATTYLEDRRPELYGALVGRPVAAALTEREVLAAADRLVEAFAATDTAAYFACFTPDATFVFHPEQHRFDDRATYEGVWKGWLDEGWRVVSCTSTERLVQVLGETAIFSHRVHTVVDVAGEQAASEERETIVFTRTPDGLLAVHEHLSPVPA
ncbi:MAG TPA: nitrilase-related carbon-nitrogen hydrolase [Nocardioides sp.]|nr:nitrilase-related carbon-nitrogen hydrolase [Nocardioides sp.]